MLTNKASTVSVIIPVYNGACYLGTALSSVLAQCDPPLEIIVIDDGSTDETAAVVAQWQQPGATPIRYHYQANAGPAAARNRGVALAQGELLAFLDADDWWQPTKLQAQAACLTQSPAPGYVLTEMVVEQEAGTGWPAALNRAHYQNQPVCYLPSALLVWRHVFAQVGAFDESYRYSDDADWFLRAKDAAIPFVVVPEPLVVKRIHGANLSHNPGMTTETLRAVHASVRRQRTVDTAVRRQRTVDTAVRRQRAVDTAVRRQPTGAKTVLVNCGSGQ
jgi:glycosyltransferase involved in cell wall biosynthesis